MLKKIFKGATFLLCVTFICSCGKAEEPQEPVRQAKLVLLQFEPLTAGEELATIHTTAGNIKIRFFPQCAPVAVENFITHAKAGYYDNVIFHRVLNDFMIQSGDPTGTGRGGESIWQRGFGTELDIRLRHFRGALSMAHAGPDTNGSQFFIVQNKNLNANFKEYFESLYDMVDEELARTGEGRPIYGREIFPEEVLDKYINDGGTPHLDLLMNSDGHTVFGHVIEGMEIVDAIAAAETDQSDKPLEDIVILQITFETYWP
ncbi:MAG: peptidylprolyl isomerase [Defluviitaleaceae bacterium]|nr:peptidylprolyl isomerase [Defluviitaleaceae bacterium]